MKKSINELLADRKAEVEFRTDRTQATFGPRQLSESPVMFDVSEKTRAVSHGGLALIHQIAVQSGLCDAINAVPVLKLKMPYHESDHVLNLAYNFLCGGTALEHIEYRRNDPVHLDMLGTHSIPDPTTAGDFCRRYSPEQIDALQDRINETRINVWSQQSKSFSVKRGQQLLIPETRYFFYITNDREKSACEIVFESNDRCNQENLIGQLKSGMNALSMPLDNLNSNGMYLVAACLAWTLKSWTVLWLAVDGRKRAEKRRKDRLLKMEFATFLQAMIMLPAQVIRSGRQTIVRFLNVNDWTATFFRLAEQLRHARHVQRE